MDVTTHKLYETETRLAETLDLLEQAITEKDRYREKNALLRTANAHLSGCLEGLLKGLENFDELQMVRANIASVLAHVKEQAEREEEENE